MMPLKKTHLSKIKKKIKALLESNDFFEKEEDASKINLDILEDYDKKTKELEKRIELLEKHNELIVSDTLILAQNMANLFIVVGEHNDILNDEIDKKKIIYH